MKSKLVALFILAGVFIAVLTRALPSPAQKQAIPLPTGTVAGEKATPEERLLQAVRTALSTQSKNEPAFLLYETEVKDAAIAANHQWATAWINPVDPETGAVVPTEPGLVISRQAGDSWQVIFPGDPGWLGALLSLPEDLMTSEGKQYWLGVAGQAEAVLPDHPLDGYHLPWKAGETIYLTRSVAHDSSIKNLSAHYGFDFAKPGYPSTRFDIYAARDGAVWMFKDSWETGHVNWSNCNEVNYLVLEDRSTTPTTYQLYLHLDQNSIPPALKQKGARVIQGQFIGVADNTGCSTGNHLHFQVQTNPNSYWGTAVDITFDEVDINGGRPRIKADLDYCRNDATYHDICTKTRVGYVSTNTVRGDTAEPQGALTAPPADGAVVTSTLHIEGWAGDQESGMSSAQLLVKYEDTWHEIGEPFTTSPFSADLDLCQAGIPDGPLSMALRVRDQAGNYNTGLPGLRQLIKNYACPQPPPACLPAAGEVALFAGPNFSGECLALPAGVYTTTASLAPVGKDNAASILVGAQASATLYIHSDLQGRGQTLTQNDSNLSDNWVGVDSLSSLVVAPRNDPPQPPRPITPENSVEYADGRSIRLAWDDGGGATEFQVEWDGTTRDWQASPWLGIGSPVSGPHTWRVRSRSSAGTSDWSSAQTFTIGDPATPKSPVSVPLVDSFEVLPTSWQTSGNWDLTDSRNHTTGGRLAWMYDTSSLVGYDTGEPNSGDLTSLPLTIPDSGQPYFLRFWYYYETEGPGAAWDQRWVQIARDGEPFTDVLQLSDDAPGYWRKIMPLDLTSYAGSAIRIRFHFATMDENFNGYKGWFIDDLEITNQAPPACPLDGNDSPETATALSLESILTRTAEICPGDVDYYRFSGQAGEQIGITVAALSTTPNHLDPYVFLYDSDGKSELARNDDQVANKVTDSYLTYRLPRTGNYYFKVRSWHFPSNGDERPAAYRLVVARESQPPAAGALNLASGTYLTGTVSLALTASDAGSGISHADFYWHSGDWQYGDWTWLATDWDPSDGLSATFDPQSIPDQKGMAFLVQVYDHAGNWAPASTWDLGIDRLPPVTEMVALPSTSDSTAVLLKWVGVDATSGIDHFELQARKKILGIWGPWQDLQTDIDAGLSQLWQVLDLGGEYGFRLRAIDRRGNLESYPSEAEATVALPASLCQPVDTWESDNALRSATVLTPTMMTIQAHSFSKTGSNCLNDEDWLKIPVMAGDLLRVTAAPQAPSAAASIQLYVLEGSQQVLLAETAAGDFGKASMLVHSITEDGNVYLRLRHIDGRVAGTGVKYEVRVVQGKPIYLPALLR